MATENTTKPKKKTFKAHDMIQCRSFTNGKYSLNGKKSDISYRWLNNGDVLGVEYQDLLYEVHAKRPSVYKPRIIILDEDFLKQNPEVQDFYDTMYTTQDLEEVLSVPASQLAKVIDQLPDGAKESLKGLASTKINNGTLDSVKKIKALDEIFDTNMLFLLASE